MYSFRACPLKPYPIASRFDGEGVGSLRAADSWRAAVSLVTLRFEQNGDAYRCGALKWTISIRNKRLYIGSCSVKSLAEVNILAFELMTIDEAKAGIASRFKTRRLAMNLPQRDLASRAGVSLASLKRFEREGLISLSSLLRLAMALGCLDDFGKLASESASSQVSQLLDALLGMPKVRHRATGRQGRKHGS